MSNFELTLGVIWTIFYALPVVLVILGVIVYAVKTNIDKGTGKNTGVIGWIIAIIIGLVILYAIANYDNISEFDPRHG